LAREFLLALLYKLLSVGKKRARDTNLLDKPTSMNTQVHPSFPSVIPKAPPGDSGLLKLLQHAPDVICTIDAAGKFVFVSSASEALWGYRPEELVGRPYMELVFSEDRELTVRAASDIMEGVEMTNFHNRYVCKNGEIRPVIWSANWDPLRKADVLRGKERY
jgi:PAS domain S-box-containing protein